MGDVPAINKHGAIALVAAAVILLQVTLTRVLSVVLWYHWAFFSISLAMLGMGAPGVWFALRSPRRGLIERSLLASAVLVPLGVAGVVHGSRAFGDHAILFCLLGLLPAALALGTSVCVLLLDAKGRAIGRRYAFDLMGACVGALLVVPLMSTVATPLLCAGVGLLAVAAYALVAQRRRWPGLVVAAMILVALVDGRAFKLSHTKEYEERAHLVPLHEKWTPTARIAVFDDFMPPGFRWGAGTNQAPQEPPQQLWLEQDGSAGTPITKFDGDWSELAYLLWDVTAVGYQVAEAEKVAIVGAGGGRDILAAKLAGADTVHAIELNAAIVEAVNERFGDFSGHVYSLPGVEARVGEGRSELTRSEGGYDLIQISMIDSWSATAAGAYALSENNLYTVEAYELYLERLADDGIVATSRWMPGGGFGLEVVRLLILVRQALAERGVSEPLDHMVLVQGGRVGTVLASPAPFDQTRLARIAEIADERGLRWFPGTSPVLKGLLGGQTVFEEKGGVVLSAPTDDRPFFFQAMSPFGDVDDVVAERLGFNANAVVVLRRLMLVMTLITVVMFFAPFVLARWMKPGPGFWRGSGYFTAIGLSFMFVEIAWLQRFVLYLGHPSLATTVTLGAMLLGAGLGSAVSMRLGQAWWARRGWAAPIVIAALNGAFGPLFEATLGLGFAARVVVAIAAIAPAGLVMGFFFPLGMVRFGERNKAWFWALNGAAGVLASVLSLALSMELGFRTVAWIGAGLYALAWGLGLGREVKEDDLAPPVSGDRQGAAEVDREEPTEGIEEHDVSPVSSCAAE